MKRIILKFINAITGYRQLEADSTNGRVKRLPPVSHNGKQI